MNKFKYHIVALSLALMLAAPVAHAQTTTDQESLIERLRDLVAQLLELRSKMTEVQAEIREEIRLGIREGMTGDDIKKIQEILATDKSIYPEGMVTGYFGPLTKNAVRRFQEKFELKVTGEIDDDTRAYLEELLKERFGESVPPGLLIAPGIRQKIELRIKDGCDDDTRGAGPLCVRFKTDDDDDDEDEDEDEDENEDEDNDEADEAADKIDDAKDAIDDLKEALDDAGEDDNGYEEASDKLEEAEDYLAEAEEAYDDEDYDEAKDKADKAESAAEEGEDELDD